MKSCILLSLLSLLFGLVAAPSGTAQVQINEWLSSNVEDLRDEDLDYPDWIELYNSGGISVDLEGYGLSDDLSNPYKWVFPRVILPAQGYLVVFASGKDKRDYLNEHFTAIDEGDLFRYFPGTQEPPTDWKELSFDDSGWSEGPSGFGFGDNDDNTQVAAQSVYVRREFQLTSDLIDEILELYLHVDYDDGFAAYLNGYEIARANLGPPGSFVAHDDFASAETEAVLYQGQKLGHRLVRGFEQILQPGKNVLSLQVHTFNGAPADLTLIPFLSAGRAVAQPVPDHPQLSFPQKPILHTNFKLSAEGEDLVLTDALGNAVDQVYTGTQFVDISIGKDILTSNPVYYLEPTPKGANTTPGYAEFVEPVSASIDGGNYSGPLNVSLSTPTSGATIHYSFDGSEPTLQHPQYTGAISINNPINVLRARAFANDKWPSFPMTETYLINRVSTLPVFSLVTDPYNFWDWNYGIYVKGPNASSIFPFFGANFWQDWERPLHIEFFETDGTRVVHQDAGVKIHGGWSRAQQQRSLRFMMRNGYGNDLITYPFFGERSAPDFQRLVLRNSGQDWLNTNFLDGFVQILVEDQDLEIMHYRPSVVLLNGEYWGIHNIRDKHDPYYLYSYAGADPDNVDILEFEHEVIEGDSNHYEALEEFFENNDIRQPANYAYVQTQMDVDNYATYFIHQIFIANTDWPQNNMKYWRPKTPDGRWRWLMFDTDSGLGGPGAAQTNTLNRILNPTGWFAPPEWSVLFFQKLFENVEFRIRFTNRYCDYLNSIYLPSSSVARLQETALGILPEVESHQVRWGSSFQTWQDNVLDFQGFLEARPAIARHNLGIAIGISESYDLTLDVAPAGSGKIALTAVEIDENWTGTYFRGVPVSMTAIPNSGFEFDKWSDSGLGTDVQVVVAPNSNYSVTAEFKPSAGEPVIHEINYNSASGFDPGDWVEIHNNSDVSLDLSNWYFRDSVDSRQFVIPVGTVVPARGFLVLCEDLGAFQSLFPGVSLALGDIGFGFSGNGELLRLYAPDGTLFDQVEYDDQGAWPTGPDGNGPTLELYQPSLDNSQGANWRESAGNGTPGAKNSVTP